jgi:predicted ester cyclase
MDSQERLKLVSAFFDEVWNDGNFGFIDEHYSPDFMLHALWQNTALGGSGEAATEKAKQVIVTWHEAASDLFMIVDEALVDGDMVVMRHRSGGTFDGEGELLGVSATDRFGEMTGLTMTRVDDDGKVTDAWTCWDATRMLTELGVVPGPPLFPSGAEHFEVTEHVHGYEDANRAVVARLYDELWNQTNPAALGELVAADCLTHAPGPPLLHGPDGLAAFINVWRTAIPNGVMTVDAFYASDDRVATRFRFEGTHTGPLAVFPPSGKRVTVGGMALSRVVDGKIVSHWCEIDRAGVMAQINEGAGQLTPAKA